MTGRRRKSDWPTIREWWYGMPRPIRWFQVWYMVPFVAYLASGVVELLWLRGHSLWYIPVAVLVGAEAAVLTCMFRLQRRLHRAWVESDYRLCTGCAHSLKGLADSGACPECGAAFDVVRDQAVWKRSGLETPRGVG